MEENIQSYTLWSFVSFWCEERGHTLKTRSATTFLTLELVWKLWLKNVSYDRFLYCKQRSIDCASVGLIWMLGHMHGFVPLAR